MRLVLSCLGFAIYTKSEGWERIKQLETSIEFIGVFINSIRPQLAVQTFIQSLKQREKEQDYVLILKRIHGSFDWISKRVHPDYRW
jgi:hypothetical protein